MEPKKISKIEHRQINKIILHLKNNYGVEILSFERNAIEKNCFNLESRKGKIYLSIYPKEFRISFFDVLHQEVGIFKFQFDSEVFKLIQADLNSRCLLFNACKFHVLPNVSSNFFDHCMVSFSISIKREYKALDIVGVSMSTILGYNMVYINHQYVDNRSFYCINYRNGRYFNDTNLSTLKDYVHNLWQIKEDKNIDYMQLRHLTDMLNL